MNLTIHRGTREIGGTCIELSAGASRIVLDLGMPLVNPDGSPFDSGEFKNKTGPELLECGLLPPVKGLYAWEEPSVAGVLLSHAHQDHYGLLGHVHPDIPIYLSEGAQRLIEVTAIFTPNKVKLNKPVHFQWSGQFTVGAFEVTPHLVDHSSFASFAFEIEAEGKRIFYTGDFREHGPLAKTLEIIKDRVRPGVDALLMEGTMFGRDDGTEMSENDLAEAAKQICRECPKAVLVCQSGQNVSRAVSFYKAARASNREFVLDFYTAHVLTELGKCKGGESLPYPGNLPGIRVWYPYKLTNKIVEAKNESIAYRYAGNGMKIKREEMAEKLDRILLFTRPGMESDLKRITGIGGSILIYSQWEGYRKNDGTKAFLDKLEALGIHEQQLHVGGHATIATLHGLVDTLKPKTLIPVHTFYPNSYEQFNAPVRALKDGEDYTV